MNPIDSVNPEWNMYCMSVLRSMLRHFILALKRKSLMSSGRQCISE